MKTNHLKIVYIHQDGKLTGSAYSLLNLIHGFKNKIDVHVALAEEGPYQDLLRYKGISCSVCPYIRFWTFPGPNWYHKDAYTQMQALRPNQALRRHILALKPDIVHINDKSALQAGISLKGCGVPIVQHLRSSYYPTHSPLVKLASIHGINSYADSLIAISEDEADGFSDDPRLQVIFNTVNLQDTEDAIGRRISKRKELGLGEDAIAVGYAANISAQKGAWDYLEMATRIRQQYPDKPIRFFMAGHAPSSNTNQGRLSRWGIKKQENPKARLEKFEYHPMLKDHLKVLGFQKDILGLMAAMDIMIVCTRLGVLGRQPFEAMAVKTPVVVTAGHTGKSRIVLHEKTGLVVPMKNVAALTDAVSRLIENAPLQEELSKQGYKHATSEFDTVINSTKVLQIYKELTGVQVLESAIYADK